MMMKSEYIQPQVIPDRMSPEDQSSLTFSGHTPVPRDHFSEAVGETGERRFWSVEMRRNEPRDMVPSPHSDVVAATVLMIWTELLVSVLVSGGILTPLGWKTNCGKWYLRNSKGMN
jgi:hypothetical protein